ncbi:hypothetical protein E0W68_10590 [Flavobacterium salilacus subsp. salilacus]|uniref:hypothetical protein n=1 Tax=Flavobacterium TaxID=237 RepID=UPI001074F6DE|nr:MULTISPECIES: hypothetical protein [Flavobacterium]KAF2518176.1 hypothetical protein E0W68_10590 [Flavobacterium salilacus subsp. salilacus]MBE1615513.1 hypothetical protein [Flavobacterium sp. SaA2.13]
MKTDKETKNVKTKEKAEVIIPAADGDLILSQNKKHIEVDLKLRVSDSQFTYTGNSYVVEISGFRGLAFSYYHTGDSRICDDTPVNGNSPQISIKETLNHLNFLNWNDNDKIRIMILNEEDVNRFTEMEDYFIRYLDTFKYKPDVTTEEFNNFNSIWNNENSNRQVNSSCIVDELINKSKSKKKKVESKASSNGYLYEMPRYTKDGGVLTLKLKQ